MGNEQLRQALRNAGLEVDDLAAKAEVDVKTARRWLSGRTPRARYRRRVADALGVSEQLLWPGAAPDTETAELDGAGEMVEVFTDRGDEPDWRELLAEAGERAEMVDLTFGDMFADGDGELLAAASRRGCRVRVLVSDGESVHLGIAEQEAGREASLMSWPVSAAALERAVEQLRPHVERGEVELRTFVGAGAYRVLIFDDQALVRLRLPGIADPDAMPVLHLTRQASGVTFDRFSEHFEALWQLGETPD